MSVLMIPRNQNRAADVAKGLAGLVGTLALVVGVPASLITWVGSPLPAGMPSVSDVADALRDTYIPDEFLVKALALVVWLVWIELVASLLVEGVAYVRGRKAGSVPLAGGMQRGAARLVATVALLGVLVASRGSSADRAAQPLAAVAPQPVAMSLLVDDDTTRDRDVTVAAVAHDDGQAASPAPVYEVQRRDTLWDIAERHLGDPFRWQEIFHLNEGCPQADGRCLTDPDLIFAGWQLELPADAVGMAQVTPAPVPAAPDPSKAPAPPASDDQSSVVLDGGMVLIDDGSGDSGSGPVDGDVLVASGAPSGAGSAVGAASSGGGGGMVLLPDDAVFGPVGDDGTAVLAGPPTDGPGPDADDPAGAGDDELASGPDGPHHADSARGGTPRR